MIAAMLMAASSSSGPFSPTAQLQPQQQQQQIGELQPFQSRHSVLPTPSVTPRVRFDQGTHFTSATAWRTSPFHVSNAPASTSAGVLAGMHLPITPPPSAPATSHHFPLGVSSADRVQSSHRHEEVDVPIIFRHTSPIHEQDRVPIAPTPSPSPYPSPSASPTLRFSAPTFKFLRPSSNSNYSTTTTTTTGSSPSPSPTHSSITSSSYLLTRGSGSGSRTRMHESTFSSSSSLSSANTSPNSMRSFDRLDGQKYGVIGDLSPMRKSPANAKPSESTVMVPLRYVDYSPRPSALWPSHA